MEWETMKLEGDDPVRHLVFNRPAVHNAVNRQLLLDVVQVCLYLETLPSCRAVMSRSKAGSRAIQALGDVTPVTIAAVHGNAIGGGAMLALACDFRIGAES